VETLNPSAAPPAAAVSGRPRSSPRKSSAKASAASGASSAERSPSRPVWTCQYEVAISAHETRATRESKTRRSSAKLAATASVEAAAASSRSASAVGPSAQTAPAARYMNSGSRPPPAGNQKRSCPDRIASAFSPSIASSWCSPGGSEPSSQTRSSQATSTIAVAPRALVQQRWRCPAPPIWDALIP
jgi:hypothetical protein